MPTSAVAPSYVPFLAHRQTATRAQQRHHVLTQREHAVRRGLPHVHAQVLHQRLLNLLGALQPAGGARWKGRCLVSGQQSTCGESVCVSMNLSRTQPAGRRHTRKESGSCQGVWMCVEAECVHITSSRAQHRSAAQCVTSALVPAQLVPQATAYLEVPFMLPTHIRSTNTTTIPRKLNAEKIRRSVPAGGGAADHNTYNASTTCEKSLVLLSNALFTCRAWCRRS